MPRVFFTCVLQALAVWMLAGAALAQQVRVGVYQNEPKIFTAPDGQSAGILTDLLREIAAREGWQLTFVDCEWQVCLDQLQAGSIDLMPDVAWSQERAQRFDFHQTPALYSWSQLYTLKGAGIVSPPDLQGKRVAVLQGAVQLEALHEMLQAFGVRAQVLPQGSMQDVFGQVQRGQAEAAVANHYFGDIRAHEFDLVESPIVFQPARLFYATAKGRSPMLLKAIDRHLDAWQQDPSSPYFSALKRWGADMRPQTVPARVWNAIQLLAALLMLALASAWFLRRQVRRATAELAGQNAKLQRMTRLYAALSQCNQAIVRCADEPELYAQICRDAVNFGGMRMAWIGVPDVSNGQVHALASFGTGVDYLEGIDITVRDDRPAGLGPTGMALRDGEPVWCQDFLHDPLTAPWAERARRYGWAASAALPLRRAGKVVGVLGLYADTVGAFDEPARNLLIEMAMDISYALDRFDDVIQRQRSDEQIARQAEALAEQARHAQEIATALASSEKEFRFTFEQAAVGMAQVSPDGSWLKVNKKLCDLLGYTEAELLQKTFQDITHQDDLQSDLAQVQAVLAGEIETYSMEKRYIRKSGDTVWANLTVGLVRQQDGSPAYFVSVVEDITDKRLAQERIEQLAHFDQLTGLPNRELLRLHFRFALSLAQRQHVPLAVMFLDLDHFKSINDTLGHSIGDQLLMEVGRRLKAVVREEDMVSRQGGDEFILVLPGLDANGAAKVARKLIDAVSVPYQYEMHELVATPSIGIALFPQDGDDAETLSKKADAAMYQAKKAGRNDFRFYTQSMQRDSARHLRLATDLRHALARQELFLLYQPQVAMQDARVVGAEALLRWQHPELGLMSPAEFIPIAEATGLIIPIGEWVLRTAAQQMRVWQASGWSNLTMAVNLSAVQFRHLELFSRVTSILSEVGLPAHALELELTEAMAMDDPPAAMAVMARLHGYGIRLSIDDFGTGYSSLAYLKRFQVYKLKIDQSFVRDIDADPEDKAIVTAIINMASSLGMRTIAEGVETAEQLAFLRLQGCNEVQGYYFSKPLTAQAFEQYLGQAPGADSNAALRKI